MAHSALNHRRRAKRGLLLLSIMLTTALPAGCIVPRPQRAEAPPTVQAEMMPAKPAPAPVFPQTEAATPAPTETISATLSIAEAVATTGTEITSTEITVTEVPQVASSAESAASEVAASAAPFAAVEAAIGSSPSAQPPTPNALLNEPVQGPIRVALDPSLPLAWADALRSRIEGAGSVASGGGQFPLSVGDDNATTRIALGGPAADVAPVVSRYFAVAVPFDTLQDDISLADVTARWQGAGIVFTGDAGQSLLPFLLGQPGASVTVVNPEELIGRLEADRNAIALIPFEQIDPRYKLLKVDGANLLSNQLAEGGWPLTVQANVNGMGAGILKGILTGAVEPVTNRNPARLTTLMMTGVTAMARGTAAAIERNNRDTYPAEIIGPELALADITHISNEIPFIEGCEVNNTYNNLILCSDPAYWAALELAGTDIVGLSGNHVNDFGRDGARESLQWYKNNGIPIYGSGLTVDEACAPLLWEHNGNTFAFIAALAFGPEAAWVTDTEPGACYFYEHKERILNTIRTLAAEVDIVAVELQYEETYFPYPTSAQITEFRELRTAGADLVTGVQSHVPQAQEPYGAYDEGGPGIISYGLGNLFFDQMWSWETRSELYARHTIHEGHIINTEILTGVLEDFAQPRWADADERALILSAIFRGAPPRP